MRTDIFTFLNPRFVLQNFLFAFSTFGKFSSTRDGFALCFLSLNSESSPRWTRKMSYVQISAVFTCYILNWQATESSHYYPISGEMHTPISSLSNHTLRRFDYTLIEVAKFLNPLSSFFLFSENLHISNTL